MTLIDRLTDSADSYATAIAALRLRAVMDGAAPREGERVDLQTMLALSERERADAP